MNYTDCHIKAYSSYVTRTAAFATSGSPQTLPFRQWFRDTYSAEPGFYIGLNYSEEARPFTQA